MSNDDPTKIEQTLRYLNALERNVEKIKDGVCFARCYYLVRKRIPVWFWVYLWCVKKFIQISHRVCSIKFEIPNSQQAQLLVNQIVQNSKSNNTTKDAQ